MTSLFYETKHRATDFANKVLNLFSNEYIDNTIKLNENHIQRRYLNEFGEVLSSGTRSPDDMNIVYGTVIYKTDDNQTEDYNRLELVKEIGLQQDGPTFATKTTSTSRPQTGFGDIAKAPTNPDNTPSPFDKIPGTFGSGTIDPLTEKQVI